MAADHQLWSTRHHRRAARGVALALLGGIMLTAASATAQPEAPAESPPPVEILRGSVAPPVPRIEPDPGADESLVIAGERLWLVDEASGRLTGCRLINTIDVGRQAIRCTERRLPRSRPVRD